MEKLLPLIEFLKKNRFWLTTGLLAVAMIATWFIAADKLNKKTAADISTIETQIRAGETIKKSTAEEGVVAHPNESTKEGMILELDEGIEAVLEAWRVRRSKQEPLLVWSKEFEDVLEFNKIFDRYDPPERFPTNENGRALYSLLQNYKRHIPERMNGIAKIITTDWKYGSQDVKTTAPTGQRGAPGAGGLNQDGDDRGQPSRQISNTNARNNIVVEWDEVNQELWNSKLTQFGGKDDNRLTGENLPSPLQIYMLQQDLWLLEAMFNIIAKVNEGATSNDFANIKRIDHVVFGREAQKQLGQLSAITTTINQAATGGDAPTAAPTTGARSGPAQNNSASAPVGFGLPSQSSMDPLTADPARSPFHGRYVNANFEPISAEAVRAVANAESLPAANIELVVAKRVPVRIALVMDERRIADFIAACAESAFAFEIHQVRLNRHPGEDPPSLDGIVSAGSASDEGPTREMGGGGTGGGMIGEDSGAPGSDSKKTALADVEIRTSFDVAVEFYGIVKIYNPVEEWILRGQPKPVEVAIPSTGEDDPAEATAQPADVQPADAQPADAQPADAQPADAQPADAQPAEAQPAAGQPVPVPDAGAPADPAGAPPTPPGG